MSEGAQAIVRATKLIDRVARSHSTGARLTDLAAAEGLHLATARRILQSLVAAGLLSFNAETKTYIVGPSIYSYAIMAGPWLERTGVFNDAIERIAQSVHDTVTVLVRSGDDAICIARTEGSFPVKVLGLVPGDRRALGIGSGAGAILAALKAEECDDIVRRNGSAYERFGITGATVDAAVSATRQHGFCFNPGSLVKEIHAVGVPLMWGENIAAISVVTIAERMSPDRIPNILASICDAITSIPNAHFIFDRPSA